MIVSPWLGFAAVPPALLVVWMSTAVGAVLSTMRLATTVDVVVFPAWSVAIARRSMPPSGSVVVLSAHDAGLVAVVHTSVQVPEPVGARWMRMEASPEPASLAVAVRVTVARRYAPGSATDTVGPVLSIRRFATTLDAVVLPAASAASTRRS